MPTNTKKKLPNNKKGYGQGWAKSGKSGSTGPLEFTAPSGTTCLVRRVGLNGLITAGILESMDSLTAIVDQEVIPAAEGKPKVNVNAVLKDAKKFQDMIDMLDKITVYAVVEPKLTAVPMKEKLDFSGGAVILDDKPVMVPVEPEDREWTRLGESGEEEPVIYVDQIDLIDKTAIMDFVMGASNELADFRP
jgi:hypothetical protein